MIECLRVPCRRVLKLLLDKGRVAEDEERPDHTQDCGRIRQRRSTQEVNGFLKPRLGPTILAAPVQQHTQIDESFADVTRIIEGSCQGQTLVEVRGGSRVISLAECQEPGVVQ